MQKSSLGAHNFERGPENMSVESMHESDFTCAREFFCKEKSLKEKKFRLL